MKALTIRHPWPWAICYLGKDVENRCWMPSRTRLREGELLAIHAGVMTSTTEIAEAFMGMDVMGCIGAGSKIPRLEDLRTQESSIVAVVTYAGAVTSSTSRWFVGSYGWKWNPESLIVLPTPVRCGGARGLWTVPTDVLAQVLDQVRLKQEVL